MVIEDVIFDALEGVKNGILDIRDVEILNRSMGMAVSHDFRFNPRNITERIEQGWWIIYYGGPSACCWLVPATLNPDTC